MWFKAQTTEPLTFAESHCKDCRRINHKAAEAQCGSIVERIVNDDTLEFNQPLFILGGAPQAHGELRGQLASRIRKLSRGDRYAANGHRESVNYREVTATRPAGTANP
jgi:hypothetical protein